jgi:CheY-like chemotaxis protein
LDLLEQEAQMLAKDAAAAEKLLSLVSSAREGATRMHDIVADLKSFSSPVDVPLETVDIHDVLDVAAATAAHEIRLRARFSRDYGNIRPVVAVRGRLIQVFVNLLVNAAQAIPDGNAVENEVRVVTSMEGPSSVVVEVLDTGRGFADTDVARLFEPFFTTKDVHGTGLGLSIAQRLVLAFGGTIAAEPRAPRGAVFRVTLPAESAPKNERTAPPAVIELPPGVRVLLAEDEIKLGRIMRDNLAPAEVVVVGSGREAIERLKNGETYEAILCDLHMVDLGGADVYEWIEAARPDLTERTAFMSGGAFTQRTREFLARVRRPFLEKPFDAARLRWFVGSLTKAAT